ncbi:MAG: hypothetical protein JJ992_24645, partial [Planctomycetes bacterium]|nr:hypothetical protein [Planctomycetota bacterium]
DRALEQGVLWFPEPLSLGSNLPQEIENHLESRALNIENRWETNETRLTAWTAAPADRTRTSSQVAFGPLTLTAYSVQPLGVPGDNSVLSVTLEWDSVPAGPQRQVAVSLVDEEGNVWSERVYAAPTVDSPGATTSQSHPVQSDSSPTDAPTPSIIDRFGIQVPAGTPPGTVDVRLSVLDSGENPIPATSASSEDPTQSLLLQRIEVTAPPSPVSPIRIPFDYRVGGRQQSSGAEILGVSDIGKKPTALAGSDMQMKIGLRSAMPVAGNLDLDVALVDAKANASGQALASWQGWPLPEYPIQSWPQGTVVLAPVTLPLPAEMDEGMYKLVVSLVDDSGQSESVPVELATVQVVARPRTMQPPSSEAPVSPPVQFGTHAKLVGYDVQTTNDAVDLSLTWEVIQPLRPQHHIFVHLVGADGVLIAQQDGTPETSSGPAPTGSWRTGEIITTEHHLPLSALGEDAAELQNAALHVGLYDPDTGIRLPATIDGTPSGDSAIITLSP